MESPTFTGSITAWQLCPLCKGDKTITRRRNPCDPGTTEACKVCTGTGIISVLTGLPPTEQNSPKFQATDKPSSSEDNKCPVCVGQKVVTRSRTPEEVGTEEKCPCCKGLGFTGAAGGYYAWIDSKGLEVDSKGNWVLKASTKETVCTPTVWFDGDKIGFSITHSDSDGKIVCIDTREEGSC